MIEHICDALKMGNELGGDDLRITFTEEDWYVGNQFEGIYYILYCPFCGEKLEAQKEKENTNV